MHLQELLTNAGVPCTLASAQGQVEVRAVCYDSRRLQRGDLFVAIRGTASDGHNYLEDVARGGAVAAIVEGASYCVPDIPCIAVRATRPVLADLAATLHEHPSSRLHITGITGTDGKTTSTFLLSHILSTLGMSTGLLSTVAFKIGDRWEDNKLRQSTLESPEIQSALAEMVSAGVSDVVLEATSHGLVLDRVRNCLFDDAIVTNITSEHLEFHGTRERYVAAKALLLAALRDNQEKPGPRFAAVNVDDEGSSSLVDDSPVEVITFGLEESARVRAVDLDCGAAGSTFIVEVDNRRYRALTPLPGLFNVYNCLGVIASIVGRDLDLERSISGLRSFGGVPGRMNRIEAGQDFAVIVDYAHTAASLEKVLTTVRPLARGRVIAVFGSAGERDREKRPAMGAVAARCADLCVFTDEDPRTEPSLEILEAIAAGARKVGALEGTDFWIVADRREAINWAIAQARAGDLVLLAGKGHEKNMFVGGIAVQWDEAECAREALRARGYGV